MMLQLFIQIAC
uniref:Uncharacterized protein n=1 Tax=Rhizophora mucronata TaxID=61149 RepID=A0A2P2KZ17_RHIMU